jgi:hypothetical protein
MVPRRVAVVHHISDQKNSSFKSQGENLAGKVTKWAALKNKAENLWTIWCCNLPGTLKIMVVITTKIIMGNFVFQAVSPRKVLIRIH